MKRKCVVMRLSAMLGVAMFAVLVHAQEAQNRMTVNWSDPSRPGLVKVSLMNGSISVRTHTGREVIIGGQAVPTQNASTRGRFRRIGPSGVGLAINEMNNVLTISSFQPGSLDLQVPPKTNLDLRTTNGGVILVDSVEGEIEVMNSRGNVRLNNVAGSVIAHAMKGNLSASLRDVASNRPLSFTSMNGNIEVTLPQALKATLKILSDRGAVHTDFDVTLRSRTNRTTIAAVNGGGTDIEIRTLNGNVYLRQAK